MLYIQTTPRYFFGNDEFVFPFNNFVYWHNQTICYHKVIQVVVPKPINSRSDNYFLTFWRLFNTFWWLSIKLYAILFDIWYCLYEGHATMSEPVGNKVICMPYWSFMCIITIMPLYTCSNEFSLENTAQCIFQGNLCYSL